MEKLTIERVYKESNRLVCALTEAGVSKEIYVEVEDEFVDYLVDDRADGFFTICVYKSFKEGYELESKVPCSERLLYQVKSYMLNVYAEAYKCEPISISAPSTSVKLQSVGGVGTGITCGVDSLYTIEEHSSIFKNREKTDYDVTHLVLLNVGSHDIGSEDAVSLFNNRINLARNFCNDYGFKFVKIDSNFRSFLPYDYTEYHGIVNGSSILTLESLFKVYYSSSSYKISEFKINPHDVSQFELLNLAVLSTENTTFYTTGGDVSRYAKVKALADWEPAFNYLNVCNSQSDNCSKIDCVKCCRTMIELDALNALERFSNVFNLEMYNKNKYDYLAEFYARKILRHDHYAIEMWDDLMAKYSIPWANKVRAIFRFISYRLKIYGVSRIITLVKEN